MEIRLTGTAHRARMHVRVKGMVQGVGFRWFVRMRARSIGVAGWVRNAADGSVEVAAEGSDEQLSALRVELLRGPRGARVEALEEVRSHLEEEIHDPFDIIH